MYIKLILRNAQRSAQDYVIYIVTLSICVAMFYAFLSISSSYYNPTLANVYHLTAAIGNMKSIICSIALLLVFLISYVNKFMIKQKQKEFAMQTIMGMEQNTSARLFFAETLIMGIISIAVGILIGVLLSQFIHAMVLTAFGETFQFVWLLYPDTSILTVGFFVLVYLIVGVFNIRTIKKLKIIEMLEAQKNNEKDIRASKFMPILTVLFALFLIMMVFTGFSKMHFYFDPRFPIPLYILFYGNILAPLLAFCIVLVYLVKKMSKNKLSFAKLISILLIADIPIIILASLVPIFIRKYSLSSGFGNGLDYMVFVLIAVTFAVSAFFYLIGDWIMRQKENSLHKKYHGENLFFFGQIITKLQTTTKTMTLISLTLILSICLFLTSPILVGWSRGFLEKRMVFDVHLSSEYNNVSEENQLPTSDYAFANDFLEKQNIPITSEILFAAYLPKKDQFHERYKYDFPAVALSLSDYNQLRRMISLKPITLQKNEFTTQWHATAQPAAIDHFLDSHGIVETDNGNLSLATNRFYQETVGEQIYNSYTQYVYIFPDAYCKDLLAVKNFKYIHTKTPISYIDASTLQNEFNRNFPDAEERIQGKANYNIRLMTLEVNGNISSMFILNVTMTYLAVVLLVICFTILSLQQLSDAMNFKYRFDVLRKLGVDENRIQTLILKQLALWFALPVLIAILGSTLFIAYLISSVYAQISAYIGIREMISQLAIILTILFSLLVCYFISTWILYKKTIDSST